MSANQTILNRELFIQALRHMGEDDLLYLNRMVVERLNLLAQAKSTVQLAQFAEGDRVRAWAVFLITFLVSASASGPHEATPSRLKMAWRCR
jgi:hypothetical protein